MTARTAPVRVAWPVDLRQAIHAELVGHLPVDVAALVEQARREGYAAGRLETLRQVAANWAEFDILGAGWQHQARKTAEQWIADRIALFEAGREKTNARLGRPPGYEYRGGPVDWETGMPVNGFCSWLRRRSNATTTPVVRRRPQPARERRAA